MTDFPVNRRDFLKTSTSAAVAAWAINQRRAYGANERLGVGVIGCGGRGNHNIGEVAKISDSHNVEIVALCDVWTLPLEKTTARVQDMTGKKPFTCRRFPDLLVRPEVDAVIITTPDHAHSPILAAAARAGKHAYCEKPMASRLEDAIDAVDAVKEAGTVVQIGTQRRSEGKHKAAAKLVQTGLLGTVSQVNTAWHRNVPSWARPYDEVEQADVDWEQFLMGQTERDFDPRRFRCWHLYRDYTTGLPGLLGSHVTDLGVWYMDDLLPLNGTALGGIYVWKDGREHCDTIECLWEFPKGFLMKYANRLGNDYPFSETMVYGTNGTFDATAMKATPLGGAGDGKLKEEISVAPEPDESHMANFIESIRENKETNAPIEVGYAHSVASILASESQRLGTRLVYDREKREIKAG
ncbi:MAG: Gfo/Idh/MocA family oxidoreductase [Candidatus Omnitrophica bacterium]|nr:Gfo/Idh/MocA family oxidoreductase [Candidatus Omnitrophota bacterium]